MCTLLVWKQLHPRFRFVAAANRDEYLARPALPPRILSSDPVVVGGQDVLAGGSWFVVTRGGLVVALTNRRGAGKHDPAKRSRGSIVLEVASENGFEEARNRLARIDARAFNPFILVVADAFQAAVAHAGADGLRVAPICDGAHAVTNWDLDADEPGKAARARRLALEFPIAACRDDPDVLAGRLHALLADHGSSSTADDALCVHRPESAYGTRSSSIVILGANPSEAWLYHVEGPPCTAPLDRYSALLCHETRVGSAKGD